LAAPAVLGPFPLSLMAKAEAQMEGLRTKRTDGPLQFLRNPRDRRAGLRMRFQGA
jgi:hypothetical protein